MFTDLKIYFFVPRTLAIFFIFDSNLDLSNSFPFLLSHYNTLAIALSQYHSHYCTFSQYINNTVGHDIFVASYFRDSPVLNFLRIFFFTYLFIFHYYSLLFFNTRASYLREYIAEIAKFAKKSCMQKYRVLQYTYISFF